MAKRDKDAGAGMHKALTHPMRADILVKMQEQGRLSPVSYSSACGQSLNLSAYHFNTLLRHGAIELVDTKPRRGAVEHIYSLNPESPVVRLLLASKVTQAPSPDASDEFLRKLVGEDAESKTALNITPIVVDKDGRKEVRDIIKDASKRLRDAESASRKRLEAAGEQGTPLHVAMAAFRWDREELAKDKG